MATIDIGQIQSSGATPSPVVGTPQAPVTLAPVKGKKKANKTGVNQLQQDLISQLFNSIKPSLGGFAQSNFNSNVQPSLFNFDPSQAYQGFQGMNAAQAQFNPNDFFGQLPQAQAAMSNYDPNEWLNKFNTNTKASLSNFNPNNFMSQLTSDYISSIGSDANELGVIRNDMRNLKGLPQLDPSTQNQLDSITRANNSQIDLQFGESKKALLEDMFGRGLQTSTVALDNGGKLLYGRDQLSQQEQANAANRGIDLQKNMRDFLLQNLLGQASTVRDQYQAKAQQAGLSQQGDLARMSSSLENSLFNAGQQNQVGLANASNNLNKSLAGNQTAAQISQFNAGNQQQSNLANSQMQFDRGNLAAQLMQQIALSNAGFQQEANQFNAGSDLDIRNNINNFSTQTGLANAGFTNEANQFNTGLNQQTSQNNLQAILSQLGMRTDLLGNMTNQFFNRKQGNKQINLQQLQLELERQQQEKQLAFQREQLAAQIQQQKGGLFGKIFGAIAPLALNLIPGIGTAASVGLSALSAKKKYVRGS